jgi:predicted O-linked N-acetylglucosamine transferase (SPINDLY family)
VSALRDLLSSAANHAASGRVDDALAAYRGALELAPSPELHHNVGVLLFSKGEIDGAERSFADAARLKPEWIAPALALGHLYFRAGRYADAERAFEHALSLDPNSVEAMGNLGLTLQRRGRWRLALPHLERARALAPADVRAWFALRTTLLLLGRVEDALQDFLRFEPDAPLSAELVTSGLIFSRFLPDAAYEAKYLPQALGWAYRPDQAELAAVTLSRAQYCDLPRDSLRRIYEKYNELQQENRHGIPALAIVRRQGERIRVGYLSADFRSHVMGRIMRDVLASHDRSRFEWHLYSLAPPQNEDAVTGEFRKLADRFASLADLDDIAAARAIADDGVDVLVDLMGHSSFARPGIMLWKPVPVIVTHLGYHGCVGLEQVDFKLTDAYADPLDAAAYQLETPLALDTCVLPVRRVTPADKPIATRDALGITERTIVFGAFVSMLKLSPRCLALWRDILERVPDSLLALSPQKEADRPLYLRRLSGFGIPAGRIVFIPVTGDDAANRTRYAIVDIVLDTLPYTGGDTTAAALDMGVPVVSRVGIRHAERVTFSLLSHLGVTETIARSDEEYVAIACGLAGDTAWRTRVASEIARKLPASGLADAGRYARSLEQAYMHALSQKIAKAT